ncbi:SurA N-terminal domain-containing protein [Candidatus Saccharibacteria bacterium]|nr:SurA N-terminal domain-containing protein [Candidatus Saccharibacteria bacterium]
MKKFLRSKLSKKTQQPSSRITNETVAEHRERILAGGRRFKYPVQYARHRLVFNTILISVVALVLITSFIGWQLYPQQNSSTFFYRITRVLPLPVAVIDGENVPYSSYLMGYRSQAHYLETKEGINLQAPDSKSQVDYIKRKALDDALSDSYAAKLAREKGIKVTTKQVDDAIAYQRKSRDGIASQETYDAIVRDHFDWTPSEAREVTARKLLRQEVAYSIDSGATDKRDKVIELLKTESDFDKIVKTVGGSGSSKVTAGVTPLVPRTNQDGGLAAKAATLEKGATSDAFKSSSGDGYYIVRLLDSNNDGRISYAYIKIPLTMFKDQFDKVRKDGKVNEYITVAQVQTQPISQ